MTLSETLTGMRSDKTCHQRGDLSPRE